MEMHTDSTLGLTTMEEEVVNRVDAFGPHFKPIDHDLTPNVVNPKDFFKNPRAIASGTFAAGGTEVVYTQAIDTNWLFSTAFPTGAQRLNGVHAVNFKLKFTLAVAANPFSQGHVCLNFQPGLVITSGQNFVRNTRPLCVNLPHVTLDFAEQSMAELTVPVMSERDFYILRDNDALGNVSITTLAPLIAPPGGITAGTHWQLLLTIVDMDLIGCIPTTVVTQSGLSIPAVEAATNARPLSTIFTAAGTGLKMVSKNVPMLSSLLGTPVWLLGKAAKLAYAFGFATPLVNTPPLRTYVTNVPDVHYVDRPKAIPQLDPFSTTALSVGPSIAQSDVDEMALAYILAKESYLGYTDIPATTARNALIAAFPVSPAHLRYKVSAIPNVASIVPENNAQAYAVSHCCYFASMFRMWRGGFRFRFHFVKTKMHGGRVQVTFIPTQPIISHLLVMPANNALDGYTQVFNLRDGADCVFDVPYIRNLPMSRYTSPLGTLSIKLLEPLTSPANVSATITMCTFVSCLPDFVLSGPCNSRYDSRNVTNITTQSGLVVQDNTADAVSNTAGGVCTSVKQLISIPHHRKLPTTYSMAELYFNHWYATLYTYNETSYSIQRLVYHCYAFVRGSSDFSFRTNKDIAVYVAGREIAYGNTPMAYGTNIHIRLPHYATTRRINAFNARQPVTTTLSPQLEVTESCLVLEQSDVTSGTYTVCAGDDAQLGYYIGPPPVSRGSESEGLTTFFPPLPTAPVVLASAPPPPDTALTMPPQEHSETSELTAEPPHSSLPSSRIRRSLVHNMHALQHTNEAFDPVST
ncbi:hypothetical protein 2 [Sanxia picorna-like virus 13]|uniref:hypothetical protein 2 n=1 Tax=Sanxia picorna-like virus 13 TaxID=1923370 RepID=UPI00090B4F35|nr:hypothetical protein 2 [Sanxia picorna-like virus 13]APG77489.1 hypothetical protein 2 [Sanxia picorna-like virus 13]